MQLSPQGIPDSAVSLLTKMVAFNTVSRKGGQLDLAEKELGDYLFSLAGVWGFNATRFPVPNHADNVFIRFAGGSTNSPLLLFVSHMDTVSTEGMSIEPFRAEVREGKVFGRGACDTKGTGAAMFWALHEYAAAKRCPNNIALLFSVNEERGMEGIKQFVRRDFPKLDIHPKGAVVGEPTSLRILWGHNGACRFSLETAGFAVHSSDPSHGRSAISDMARVLLHVEEKYIARLTGAHPVTGRAQCSLNVIRGGVQSNVIPQKCVLHGDRRLVPGESWTDVVAALELELDVLRLQDKKLQVSMHTEYAHPALAPFESPFMESLAAILESNGIDAKPVGAPFCTEAGYLRETGVATYVLGPGNVDQAHTHDEWLDAADFERGVQIYREIMGADLA